MENRPGPHPFFFRTGFRSRVRQPRLEHRRASLQSLRFSAPDFSRQPFDFFLTERPSRYCSPVEHECTGACPLQILLHGVPKGHPDFFFLRFRRVAQSGRLMWTLGRGGRYRGLCRPLGPTAASVGTALDSRGLADVSGCSRPYPPKGLLELPALFLPPGPRGWAAPRRAAPL